MFNDGYVFLGQILRSDCSVRTFSNNGTKIPMGSLVKLKDTSNYGVATVEAVTAVADCIYGAVVDCDEKVKTESCSVLYKGHVVTAPSSTVFTGLKVGENLKATGGTAKCGSPVVMRKLAYDKAGTSTDCYEVQF